MIILIRGHIRNSFDNDDLYNLIKKLSYSNNISIYIHTWHILQSSLSWREITENNMIITNDLIYSYFKDISHLIKLIIIDNDTEIKLIGNLEGKIINTECPIKGWKNLWYGNYKMINYIKSMNSNHNDMIINMRFDIFSNSNSLTMDEILNFINTNKNNSFVNNTFLIKDNLYGVDNIFIGNIYTMSYLLINLYKNLDCILDRFKFLNLRGQEHYVYYENHFGKDFNYFVYKVLNNFHNMNNDQLTNHWINHGINENRIYSLPDGFDYNFYRISNNVIDWDDEKIILHWYNHGKHEGYKYKLPDNFNFDVYKIFNNVLDWNNGEIVWHWTNHGINQGWKYKLPDNFDIDAYRILNNFTDMNDYQIIYNWYNYGQYENKICSF
jgi:hypothetical protein